MAVDDSTRSLASCRNPRRSWSYRLAQFPAFVLHTASFVASGLEGSARTSAAFGHSHNNEHLHTSGARCDAGGQQSSRRNGSSEEKSRMKKRGGKKAALTVPKDAKSFQFHPRPSS